MRKPTVDYRGFRLSKIREPQYSHLLLLLGWVAYFILYVLTENLIPAEACHPVHCALDDRIPFCEYFVIAYCFWYVWVAGSLLFGLLYDVETFKNLSKYIIVTQVVAMAAYIIYPTRQDLRPEVFPRDNFFTWVMGIIYSVDTSTGVCPSLHVAYSVAMASVFLKRKDGALWYKIFVIFAAVMVSLATMFVKQHSAVDVFMALPVCLLAEILVYGKSYWYPKFRKKSDCPQ